MKLYGLPTIFVDFETYWADDYTLSKITTQEYVQGERFKAHGACVAINNGPIKWVTHSKLAPVLINLHNKYPNAIWVAHNHLFEASILAYHYGIHPRFTADTAAMSRALVGPHLKKHSLDKAGEFLVKMKKGFELIKSKGIRDLPPELEQQIASYCEQDVAIMRAIYELMCPHFPARELETMTWVTEMMSKPAVYMDSGMLEEYHHSVVNRKVDLLAELGVDRADIMSNDKFATLLLHYGVEPPMKLNKKGEEKYAFAKTDAGLKELLEHENPDVQALVAARIDVKSTIEETRSKTFYNLSLLGPVSMPYAYSGAVATHRLSGRDGVNPANLKRGGVLRKSITAPDGYVCVVSDKSQIELRFTLYLSGHHDYVQKLASGGDLYSELATKLYGTPVTRELAKKDPIIFEQRHVGKEVTLGSGYGIGAAKTVVYLGGKGVKVDLDFAKAAIDLYRSTYFKVPKLWYILEAAYTKLLRDGQEFTVSLGGWNATFGFDPLCGSPGLLLPGGLRLKYPGLHRDEEGQWKFYTENDETKIWGGHFLENICQALTRCAMMDKTVKVNRRYQVVMSTYDELTALVPEDELEEGKAWIHSIMEERLPWLPDLPINAETTHAKRYGDAK